MAVGYGRQGKYPDGDWTVTTTANVGTSPTSVVHLRCTMTRKQRAICRIKQQRFF